MTRLPGKNKMGDKMITAPNTRRDAVYVNMNSFIFGRYERFGIYTLIEMCRDSYHIWGAKLSNNPGGIGADFWLTD